MISTLLKIRFLQIYRTILDIGIFRAIILLLILLPLFFVFLYQKLDNPLYSHIITGTVLFVIFTIHRQRNDFYFLYKISKNPLLVYYSEYFLFSIPVMILFLIKDDFFHLFIFNAVLPFITLVIPKTIKNKTYNFLIEKIPNGLFEWQSGFRKNFFAIFLIYGFALLGIYKIWFSAIALFLLMITVVSFFSEYEPLKIMESQELHGSEFIKSKLFRHLRFLIIMSIPIFLIALIHFEYSIYIFVSFVVLINLLVFSILLKYAYYFPKSISAAHQIITSIACFISVILPLSVVILLANLILYFKCKQNLKLYLDAYNK